MKICHTCRQTYSNDLEFCLHDGTRLIPQATDAEAQLAAGLSRRFRLVRRLGVGGMGTVFLAEQIGVGNRPVALKVLNRKLLDDPDFLLRFQNEAGSTGRIHHPNVVSIHESAQSDDGTPYIAMEFLEGESLREALKRRGALPLTEVVEILQQAARGLNAAHRLGIIHRDIKPDNIFLTRSEEGELVVKVVDFGIAKLRESATHTQTGMVLGTPAYMSCEQASGMRSDELDARSDIYALGVVTYEMVTGRVPFHSDTPAGFLRKHLMEEPPPFRAVAPGLGVPPQVEAVVMKALKKEREERYQSALEFARAFVTAADQPLGPGGSQPLATTKVVQSSALGVGDLLAHRYKVLRFIGEGGMGEVYEAEDCELRERVALKTILPEIASREESIRHFKREIQLARKVTHPNVCRIFDLVYHGATIFLTMELLEGETLSQRLRRTGALTTSEAFPLVAQMAAALAAAHKAGIVHRDFKCSNVMLVPTKDEDESVRPVIMDFGLALRRDSGDGSRGPSPATEAFAGTPAYMAPEQVEGGDVTPAADIYALGVVMYEMVTGRCPFEGDTPLAVAVKRLREPAPSPRNHSPGLDSRWEKAILCCLERNPKERFESAEEIIKAIQPQAPPVEPSEQPRMLEAAAPKHAAVGRSIQLLAMIRRVESEGLKSLLNTEETPALTKEDIRAKPFRLEFPLDSKGTPQSAEIVLRLESPDFEPKSQTKKLMVPPERDSEVCTFLLTPRVGGELLINLEVLKGEVLVASRAIRTVAEITEQQVAFGPNVLVSIPLEVIAYGLRAPLRAPVSQSPTHAASNPLPSAPPPPHPNAAPGKFTELFSVMDGPKAAQPLPPHPRAPRPVAPPPPRPIAKPGPGEFTPQSAGMNTGQSSKSSPSSPSVPSAPPSVPSAQPPAGKPGPGSFTQMFQASGANKERPEASPLSPAKPQAPMPTSSQIFQRGGNPMGGARPPGFGSPSQPSAPLPGAKKGPGELTALMQGYKRPTGTPATPAPESPPPLEGGPENAPGDSTSMICPPSQPVAPVRPAAAPPAPVPATPKIVPPSPKYQPTPARVMACPPPAPQAMPPGAKRPPIFWVLVLGLGGMILIAMVLGLFFAFMHGAGAFGGGSSSASLGLTAQNPAFNYLDFPVVRVAGLTLGEPHRSGWGFTRTASLPLSPDSSHTSRQRESPDPASV
jgi:serine/threonine protein kinase